MSNSIDYYFTCISPFAYLGHKPMMEIAQRHGKTVNFKPFNIFDVWKGSGAQPPAERAPVRQRYRKIEIQRVAVLRDTCMNPSPEFFPTDPTPADLCICALAHSGIDASQFSLALGRAVWEQNLNVADETVLASLLVQNDHDASDVLALSKTDEITAIRNTNTQEAIAADAIGAPAYVDAGEVFWGQDRLEYLDQMITSGRRAFSYGV